MGTRIAVVLVVCLAAGGASGESRTQATAKRHFFAGQKLFDQARYEEALHEYQQSYTLAPYPALLYKIALCQDQLDRAQEALDSYTRYLQLDPTSARREGVQERIDRLRQSYSPPLVPVYPAAAPPPDQPAKAASPMPKRTKLRIGGGVALAMALVFVAAGIGTAVVREQEAARWNSDDCISFGTSREAFCHGHYDSAIAQQNGMISSWVLAAAFTAAGAAMVALAPGSERVSVSAALGSREGGVVCALRF